MKKIKKKLPRNAVVMAMTLSRKGGKMKDRRLRRRHRRSWKKEIE